ncbi:MAG TPA: bifunctional protein-serine/threonine kinase/phosphatase [Macromonas sp.]|nr:bifunctional protein-serine/threonine kinase/phosphatase [Macromonas sp.]
MAFEIEIGFASQAGRKPVNEDFCAAMLPTAGQEGMGSIVAIADGVSAGGMGREAAQTTITSLVRDYHEVPETWDTTVALDRIIAAQNAWLAGVNRRRHPVMGLTTLTALVLRGQSYTLAHAGDTRCYLLRDGQVTLLTHDHVVNHPDFSHQLLRAVGLEDHLVVDYVQGDLHVGDVFVLLSDGVHGVLPPKRWQNEVGQGDVRAVCDKLLTAALDAGSDDNVTAMVVRVQGLLQASLEDVKRNAHNLPIPPLLKAGDALDGLAVVQKVADNGINLIYQVRHPATGQCYALKTLHPSRAHDPDERAMLAHEAWLAARMQTSAVAHHLVKVHETHPLAVEPSAYYVLYDWVNGDNLQQLLERHKTLGVPQTTALVQQALKVLGRLHRQGVVHRDIKPANFLQGDDGVLRLLDLGVALTGREPESMRRLHAGTPSYINPEQWGFRLKGGDEGRHGPDTADTGALPDARSDLFALGVTLYQLLTGKLPYGDVLPYQVGRYYRDPTPPSRHNPEVPIWLDHIVLKAVARDQTQRFETAEEFLLALERGAVRPLSAPAASPLMQRDPAAVWKMACVVSLLLNLLLVYWLLFLPKM